MAASIETPGAKQQRRIKQRHAKVRTGCLTCKQRKVKCDETKPAPCLRCTKGGYKCGGYIDPPKPWVFEYNTEAMHGATEGTEVDPSQHEPIKIKTRRYDVDSPEFVAIDPSALSQWPQRSHPKLVQYVEDQRRTIGDVLTEMHALPMLKPSGPYKSQEEQRAFKHFIEVCVPTVNVYSDPSVWGLSIPQAAWAHPAIKNSLIALALVNESMVVRRRQAKYGENRRALHFVNLAFRSLLKDGPSTEIAIAAGLILQFMETINNNAPIAYMHLMSAVKICEEFKQKLSRGERVRQEQADLILNHLDPTLQVALKFAEVILSQNMDQDVINHWTPEAFELKHSLVDESSGLVDKFRGTMDARNNWGAAADRIVELRTTTWQQVRYKDKCADLSVYESGTAISMLKEGALKAQKVMDHCTRLFTPIYDPSDVESCMLQVHENVLRSILHDIVSEVVDGDGIHRPDFDYDQLLERTLDLVYTGKAHEHPDLKIELGVIPPLFYLATAFRKCSIARRRQASHCLITILGDRKEGAWMGRVAGWVADAVINVEEPTSNDNTIDQLMYYQLAFFDDEVQSTSPSRLSANTIKKSPEDAAEIEHNAGLEGTLRPNLRQQIMRQKSSTQVFLTCILRRRPLPPSPDSTADSKHEVISKRLIWTSEQIDGLPQNINQLIRQYGYQGYFDQANNTPRSDEGILLHFDNGEAPIHLD